MSLFRINKMLIFFGMMIGIYCISTVTLLAFSEYQEEGYISCSSVGGIYQSKGHSNISLNPYYSEPLMERNIFGLDDIADKENTVTIIVNGKLLSMAIIVNNRLGKFIAEKKIGTSFICNDNNIIFEAVSEGGGDGSSVQHTKTTSKFSMHESTLTIEVTTLTKSRNWIFFSDKEKTTIIYKFMRKSAKEKELKDELQGSESEVAKQLTFF